MVKITPPPVPGTGPNVVVDAPMKYVESIIISIQVSNQPQQLPAHPNRQATLHALPGNSATIYMGSSSVNASGFPLNPGAAQDTHIDDLSKVYVFGTKGDQLSIEVEWGIGQVS